jgi:hypothetical protein
MQDRVDGRRKNDDRLQRTLDLRASRHSLLGVSAPKPIDTQRLVWEASSSSGVRKRARPDKDEWSKGSECGKRHLLDEASTREDGDPPGVRSVVGAGARLERKPVGGSRPNDDEGRGLGQGPPIGPTNGG